MEKKDIEQKKMVIQYFDKWAEEHKRIKYRRYSRELMKLKVHLASHYITNNSLVLDAGCGIGNLTRVFAKYADFTIGADSSLRNVRQAKNVFLKQTSSDIVLSDITFLPFKSNSFDVIISLSTMYYIEKKEKALSEFQRILKPGGHAIFDLGNKYSWVSLDLLIRGYKGIQPLKGSKQMKNIAIQIGFVVEELKRFQLLPPFWILSRFLSSRLSNKMIDEWISSAPFIKNFSFRHLYVCKKEGSDEKEKARMRRTK